MNRRLLLLGGASGLAGCGFHPVYGPLSKGGGTVDPELAAIFVAVMGERSGQLLRQALQQRLEGTGGGGAKRYQLTGGLSVALEGLAIQQDTSSTRTRATGSATYTLTTLDTPPKPLTSGSARVLDGFNINNQQYFAADLETSAAIRRIAETAADQITLELATFFRKRAETA